MSLFVDTVFMAKWHNFLLIDLALNLLFPYNLSTLMFGVKLASINGYRYYVLFVNEYTRFSWLLFSQTQVCSTVNLYKYFYLSKKYISKNTMENQLSTKIQYLIADWGGEYTNNEFQNFVPLMESYINLSSHNPAKQGC